MRRAEVGVGLAIGVAAGRVPLSRDQVEDQGCP